MTTSTQYARWCRRMGLTVEEAGQRLGVSRSQSARWSAGRRYDGEGPAEPGPAHLALMNQLEREAFAADAANTAAVQKVIRTAADNGVDVEKLMRDLVEADVFSVTTKVLAALAPMELVVLQRIVRVFAADPLYAMKRFANSASLAETELRGRGKWPL